MLKIKKKSLIVVFVSVLVIGLVLIVNLAGYMIYLEMKDDELTKAYNINLRRLNAKVYSKHIEIARLEAAMDHSGPLSGKAVIEGIVRNDGYRDVTDLDIVVRFLDTEGAVIYEVSLHPLEPSLSSYAAFSQTAISRIADAATSVLKPESSLAFKTVLLNPPKEVLSELKAPSSSSGGKLRWTGKLDYDIVSIDF